MGGRRLRRFILGVNSCWLRSGMERNLDRHCGGSDRSPSRSNCLFSALWNLESGNPNLRGLSEFLYLYRFQVKPLQARPQATIRRNSCPDYPAAPRISRRFCGLHYVSHMQIKLFRHPGYIGRLVPIDVIVDGRSVALINGGETKVLALPDAGANVQVQLQGAVSSPQVRISPQDHGRHYECGNPLWVFFDVLSFCYLPPLKNHTFFLRAAKTSVSSG